MDRPQVARKTVTNTMKKIEPEEPKNFVDTGPLFSQMFSDPEWGLHAQSDNDYLSSIMSPNDIFNTVKDERHSDTLEFPTVSPPLYSEQIIKPVVEKKVKKNKVKDKKLSPTKRRKLARKEEQTVIEDDLTGSKYGCNLKKYGLPTHADGPPYKCPSCPKSYKQHYTLTCHYRREHLGVKPYKCGTCDKSFVTITEVKLHQQIHLTDHERTKYRCPDCEEVFYRTTDLQDHIRYYHGPPEKRLYCAPCDKFFLRRGTYATHMRYHRGEDGKRVQCLYCEKRFYTNQNLQSHLKRFHTEQVPSMLNKSKSVTSSVASDASSEGLTREEFNSAIKKVETKIASPLKTKLAHDLDLQYYKLVRDFDTYMKCVSKYDKYQCKICLRNFSGKNSRELLCKHLSTVHHKNEPLKNHHDVVNELEKIMQASQKGVTNALSLAKRSWKEAQLFQIDPSKIDMTKVKVLKPDHSKYTLPDPTKIKPTKIEIAKFYNENILTVYMNKRNNVSAAVSEAERTKASGETCLFEYLCTQCNYLSSGNSGKYWMTKHASRQHNTHRVFYKAMNASCAERALQYNKELDLEKTSIEEIQSVDELKMLLQENKEPDIDGNIYESFSCKVCLTTFTGKCAAKKFTKHQSEGCGSKITQEDNSFVTREYSIKSGDGQLKPIIIQRSTPLKRKLDIHTQIVYESHKCQHCSKVFTGKFAHVQHRKHEAKCLKENSTNVFTLQGGILIKHEPKSEPEPVNVLQPSFQTAIQPTAFRSTRMIANTNYTPTNNFYVQTNPAIYSYSSIGTNQVYQI